MTSYQMLWDCPRCGTRGLLGVTHRHCPACGAAQDAQARYFPEPGSEVALEDHVYHGADRSCPYCQTPNSAKAAHCVNCGGALDGSAAVALKSDGPPVLAPRETPEAAPPVVWWKRSWVRWVVGLVVAGLVLAWMLSSKDHRVEVTHQEWERKIFVERFGPMSSGSWCDQVPGDAQVTGRESRQRSSRQVADGQSCSDRRVDQGDGSFRVEQECHTTYRDEPIYDDWCSWSALRWQAYTEEVRTGAGGSPPVWPPFQPTGVGIGALREGGREEVWPVRFRAVDGEGAWECRLPPEQGPSCRPGTRWILPVRRVGGAKCGELAAPE